MFEQPTRDRRAEQRSRTRAEIIDAAWEIARESGLAGITLRDVAARVGMRAPSLYSYFDSKNAIYDAMFAEGARDFLAGVETLTPTGDPLTDLRNGLRFYVDFATADPVRYQLLFQRTIPGFEPSPESYAPAVKALEIARAELSRLGISDPGALDLFTALGAGLTSQQFANEPGGDRWTRLVDPATEMFYAYVLPRQATRRAKGEGQ